jgi:hypothetical protein
MKTTIELSLMPGAKAGLKVATQRGVRIRSVGGSVEA